MLSLLPSARAMAPFVSVENMMRLVHNISVETVLAGLTDAIEADFRRWDSFDKTPRVASHSREGVIELMPIADGSTYSIVACSSAQQALEGAQVITTRTADKQSATVLTDDMVGAGVHINAIGWPAPTSDRHSI